MLNEEELINKNMHRVSGEVHWKRQQ